MARKVLISAGGSGIGRCIAEAFLAHHDEVFVCDINAESLAQFQKAYPALHIYACDLANHDEIKSMFSDAISKLGILMFWSIIQGFLAQPLQQKN